MEITLHVPLDPEQRGTFEEATRRLSGIARIAVLDQITSGRSQAKVFIVDVTPETVDGPTGLHILKLDTRRGIRKELQGYGRARETAMSKHMPVVVAQTSTEKPFKTAAILYSLAQDTFRDAIALRDIVDQRVFRARDQLDALAQVLQELFDTHAVESDHPYGLIRTELGSLLKGGRSIIRVGEDYLHLHADRELVRYEGDMQVWPNPIAYIQRQALWEEARALVWPTLCAHGDLHAENVICPKSGFRSQVPELIDFTNFREKTSLFYDLVYLELALLLRVLAPNTELRRQGWLQLGEVFDQQVLVDAERVGGPGVLSACTLLSPLRRLAADFIEGSDRPEDFESAFWLTGVVVGLNYFRKLADDPFERKLAFLIAARRLATLLDRLNVDFYRHQASYELSWLSDETTVREERSVRVPPGVVGAPPKPKRPPSHDLDFEVGLDTLGEAILEETGSITSHDYDFFSNHKNALVMNLYEEAKLPVRDPTLRSERARILVQLDGLARRYLERNFLDLCREPEVIDLPPDLDAAEVDDLLVDTRHEIDELEKELQYLESQRRGQERYGEASPELIATISDLQEKLDRKRQQLEHLREYFQPPAFFEVIRVIDSDGESVVVEQPVRVRVKITNIGKRGAAQVYYREAISSTAELLDGSLVYEGTVETGETVLWDYCFYCRKQGSVHLATGELAYHGRDPYWDQIEPERAIRVNQAPPPRLIATRAYRPVKEGLSVLIRLENHGEMIAREVEFAEPWPLRDSELKTPQIFYLSGDILGELAEPKNVATVEYIVPVDDPTRLVFDQLVEVTYWDSRGESYTTELAPTCDELAYDIPSPPPIVGRSQELQRVVGHLESLSHRVRERDWLQPVRLILLAGREGTGKTRFCDAVVSQAERLGYQCFVEREKDRSDPSSVQRLLRQMLGLGPSEERETIIEQALRRRWPDREITSGRSILLKYLAGAAPLPGREYLENLKAEVSSFVQDVARQQRTLIIVENAQWIAQGIEQELLAHLMVSLLPSSAGTVMLCVTYRPQQNTVSGKPEFIDRLDRLRSELCEVIDLKPLTRADIRELADAIIPFPRLSETLIDFVTSRSTGRPLYVKVLLQLLVSHGAEFLKPVDGEWQATDSERLQSEIPPDLFEAIQRLTRRLSLQAKDLIGTLSAAGVDLPWSLVQPLVKSYYPPEFAESLEQCLSELVKHDFLVRTGKDLLSPESDFFVFEHQIKREAILQSLSEETRASLRQQVVTIMLERPGIFGELEQLRQVARHLSKAPSAFQHKHADQFLVVARAERRQGNFKRSLYLYERAIGNLSPDSVELARAHIERGELHRSLGIYADAQSALDKALQLIQSSQLKPRIGRREKSLLLGRILKVQGVLAWEHQKRKQQANVLLLEARTNLEGPFGLRRRWPNRHTAVGDLVEIYIALARVHGANSSLCRKACEWAIEMAEWARDNRDDSSLLPMAYITFADLHLRSREPGQALEWYRRADEAVSDDYWKATILCRIAELYERPSKLRNTEEALRCYRQAREIQERLGDLRGLAASYGGIGNILVERQQWEDALPICEKAHSYQRLVGDHNRLWRTGLSLVKVYKEKDNLRKAAQYWEEAAELLFESGLLGTVDRSTKQGEIRDFLKLFAAEYDHWGEPDKVTRERHRLNTNLSDLVSIDSERAQDYLEIGESFMQVGEFDDAIAAFRNALQYFRGDAHLQRGSVFERMGDLYVQLEEDQPYDSEWVGAPDAPYDQAAHSYEDAVVEFSTGGSTRQSLRVLEKLFDHLSTDDAAVGHAIEAYLRVIEKAPKNLEVIEALAGRADSILVGLQRWANAGNLLLDTGNYLASWAEDDAADKLWNLYHRAEDRFQQGSHADYADGLSRLVQGYYRLGEIDEVVRCFLALVDLHIEANDLKRYAQELRRIMLLGDRLSRAEIEQILAHAGVVLDKEQYEPSPVWPVRHSAAWLLGNLFTGHYRGGSETVDSELRMAWSERRHTYLEICVEFAETAGQLSVALNDLGVLLHNLGALDQAAEHLQRSLKLSRRIGDDRGYATTAHNLAHLLLQRGDGPGGIGLLREAIDIRERMNRAQDRRLEQRDLPLSASEVAQIRWDKRGLASLLETYGWLHMPGHPDREALLRRARRLREEADLGVAGVPDMRHFMALDWAQPVIADPFTGYPGTTPWDSDGDHVFVLPSPPPVRGRCPVCGGSVDMDHWACTQCDALICLVCGQAVRDGDESCPHCGAEQPIFCDECGARVRAEDQVCPKCHKPFD